MTRDFVCMKYERNSESYLHFVYDGYELDLLCEGNFCTCVVNIPGQCISALD